MDIQTFTARVREHYIEQFRAFVAEQKQGCVKGASEVKLRLNGGDGPYRQLYCVDFIKNDPPEIVELQPERVLRFKPVSGLIGNARFSIERLRWDDVLIHHDLGTPPKGIDVWFDRWFDEKEAHLDTRAEFSDAIHSLRIKADGLSIDFGSAPIMAFWDLLHLLDVAGAKNIRVTSSRTEPGDA